MNRDEEIKYLTKVIEECDYQIRELRAQLENIYFTADERTICFMRYDRWNFRSVAE
jgi:hypothetical protein